MRAVDTKVESPPLAFHSSSDFRASGGRHNVVFRPFSQGLIIETKSLLYKFRALVSAALKYNRIFHDIRISYAFAPLVLPCKDNTSVWSLSLFRDLSQFFSKSIPKKHEMDLISKKIRINR